MVTLHDFTLNTIKSNDVFLKLQVVPPKKWHKLLKPKKRSWSRLQHRPSSQEEKHLPKPSDFQVKICLKLQVFVIPKKSRVGRWFIVSFWEPSSAHKYSGGQLAVGVDVLCLNWGRPGRLSAGLPSILGRPWTERCGGSNRWSQHTTWWTLYVNVSVKENCNTPLEHTPNNPPGQLWKESLYSLLVKV